MRRLRHVPALDGLRGVAVIGVVVFHLGLLRMFEPRWLPGGDLGVELFFVLSGFLISALLLAERSDSGRIRLRAFWTRRMIRLVPPLVFLLTCYTGYAIHQDLDAPTMATTAVTSLLYFFNIAAVRWWPLNTDLGHLWSLSIEEQFYVVWPLALGGLLALRLSARTMVLVVLAGIAAVAAHTWRLQEAGVPFFQVGIRTDVRIDGLLVGALAAIVWTYDLVSTRVVRALAPLALAFVLGAYWELSGDVEHYRWWELLFATATAIVILAATDERWFGTALLSFRPLRAIGRVSYGLYLWHLPAIMIVHRHGPATTQTNRIGLALALTAAGTLGSWYALERPLARMRARLPLTTGVQPPAAPERLVLAGREVDRPVARHGAADQEAAV